MEDMTYFLFFILQEGLIADKFMRTQQLFKIEEYKNEISDSFELTNPYLKADWAIC